MWNFDSRAKAIFASPAVVGNRVYVATADKGVFSDDGAILCLDAETGAEVWRYAPDGFRATFSSPAVKDGYVVCGEGLHDTTDARINCLDTQGRLLWSLRTKSHVESSACIDGGRAIIGAGDDGYYCIDLKPGPGGKPNVRWHLRGERYKDCETSPAVRDGVVYFGLGTHGNAICAADAATGKERWRIEAPYPVFGPPTLAHGKLYVGLGNGNFVQTAEEAREEILARMRADGKTPREVEAARARFGPAGAVWCVDLKTHRVDWRFKVGRTVLGAVAAGRDRLYFGSRDGRFYCVSAAGKLIRSWNARSPILTSPALGAAHVFFATASGRLYCLAADTLEPVWDVQLGSGENFMSSPALALGHVYVGTGENGVRCLGRAQKRVALWADGARGGADRSPMLARAALVWRYPKNRPGDFAATAPLMPLGDALYVPCTRRGKPELLKLKLDPALADEGRVAWAAPLEHAVRVAPAGVGEALCVVDGTPGQKGRALHCIAAKDGKERWRFPVEADGSGQLTLDVRRLYVWSGPETLAALPVEQDGAPKPLWSRRIGRGRFAPAVPQDGILVVATAQALLALDSESGTPLWQQTLDAPPLAGPVRLGRSVYLAVPDGIALHSILDGSRLWTGIRQKVAAPPVAALGRLAAVTQGGQVAVFSVKDAKVLATLPDAKPGIPPLLAGDSVVYAAKDLMLWRGAGDEPRQWARTSWLGTVLTPLVWSGSHAYFATDKRGVVCLGPSRR